MELYNCTGINRDGTRCRNVEYNTDRCYIHQFTNDQHSDAGAEYVEEDNHLDQALEASRIQGELDELKRKIRELKRRRGGDLLDSERNLLECYRDQRRALKRDLNRIEGVQVEIAVEPDPAAILRDLREGLDDFEAYLGSL